MKRLLFPVYFLLACSPLFATDIPDYSNEEDPDMLSPAYYNAAADDSLHLAINTIVYYARAMNFHHPLQGETLPSYTIKRDFGDIVGQGAASQHHPASDMYVGNRVSEVNIYASHDGIFTSGTESPKYRHFIRISSPMHDQNNTEIATLTSIYAHVDLDLNTAGIQDGDTVKAGDLICSHLYSGTKGGPHLHYEIRFLDKEATGTEEFYGWSGSTSTIDTKSSGPWLYGYWDTNIGLGYGNPSHYISDIVNQLNSYNKQRVIVSPNPSSGSININTSYSFSTNSVSIINATGRVVANFSTNSKQQTFDLSQLPDAYYIGRILFTDGHCEHFRVLKKSL